MGTEAETGSLSKKDSSLKEIDNASSDGGHVIEGRLLSDTERKVAERKLVWKLDSRLLPCIFVIYIMNYIDRTAITSARLQGMEEDLHLSDIEYETIIAILYASYCPAQIPSNMMLNRVHRPSLYIGICVILWGITSAAASQTHDFVGLLLCRIFIGLPEAAFYPGAMYLLSRWYTRKELALRSAILYVGLLLSNAFGALMAAGILSTMEGKRGIRAWRWLFIIEGCITIFIGFCSIIILPDFPHNTRWLTADERRLAQIRLAEDAAEADQDKIGDTAMEGLRMALRDPIVLLFAVMTCSQLLGLSFVNFFPTLTQTLGFSTTVSLLLAAPPWIFSAIVLLFNARHADRSGERYLHLAVPWWGVIIGFIMALSSFKTGPRYVSMFLMASGYAGFALTLVWVSNAIPRPPAKRAAALAIVNGFGNIGNLIGSFAWKAAWGPGYHQSLIISLAALVLASFLSLIIRQLLVRKNKELDRRELDLQGSGRLRIEEAARLEGITFAEAMERKKGFRYLY